MTKDEKRPKKREPIRPFLTVSHPLTYFATIGQAQRDEISKAIREGAS